MQILYNMATTLHIQNISTNLSKGGNICTFNTSYLHDPFYLLEIEIEMRRSITYI